MRLNSLILDSASNVRGECHMFAIEFIFQRKQPKQLSTRMLGNSPFKKSVHRQVRQYESCHTSRVLVVPDRLLMTPLLGTLFSVYSWKLLRSRISFAMCRSLMPVM